MRKEKRRLERVKLLETATLIILFAFFLYVILNSFVISIINIEGSSMHPKFEDGDRLVFSRLSIESGDLKRGEIVLFEEGGKMFVKRIVGLPGEMIEIKEGKVFVNGQLLDDKLNQGMTSKYSLDSWQLKEDEFFLLGDNRSQNNSKDSRIFGPISIEKIDGKFLFEL